MVWGESFPSSSPMSASACAHSPTDSVNNPDTVVPLERARRFAVRITGSSTDKVSFVFIRSLMINLHVCQLRRRILRLVGGAANPPTLLNSAQPYILGCPKIREWLRNPQSRSSHISIIKLYAFCVYLIDTPRIRCCSAGVKFEWDAAKERENMKKHGVCFEKAQHAFADPGRVIEMDTNHSQEEPRYFCYGEVDGRILTVRFTPRGGAIRIFGAAYWRKGKKRYEQEA